MRSTTTILLLLFSLALHSQTPELTIQLGHSKLIYDVAYSPNGKFAASASADRTVKIWELEKGREVRTIYIDAGYATSVQFSNDSKNLLVGGGTYDIGVLKIYNLETGDVVTDMKGHKEYAWNAEYSIDGSIVYSTSFDQTVKMWDALTGNVLYSTQELPSLMRQLSVDPLGEYIVTTCDDDSVGATIWSAEDLSFVRKLDAGHLFEARTVEFSADGAYIIVGDFADEVAVFKRDSHTPEYVFQAHDDLIRCLASSRDGQSFFTGSDDRLIHQWDIQSGQLIGTFAGHKDNIYALESHPQLDLLLSGGSFDKSLKEWDINTKSNVRTLSGNVYPVSGLDISKDGKRLYINSNDDYGGDVMVWQLDRLNKVTNLGNIDEQYEYMDISAGKVLIGNSIGELNIYNEQDLHLEYTTSFNGKIILPRFHPSRDEIIVGYEEQSTESSYSRYTVFDAYSTHTGEWEDFASTLDRIPGSQNLEFSSDGSSFYIMESTWDYSRLNKYTDSSSSLISSIIDTNMLFPGFLVSPDDRHVLLADGRSLAFYDMDEGSLKWSLDNLPGELSDIEFANENYAYVAGGEWSSGYISLVRLSDGAIIRSKTDFNAAQRSLALDSKRNILFSGGEDSRISLFETESFKLKLTLITFADSHGEWAAIHPSGLFDGSKEGIEKNLYFTYRLEPIELFQLKERYYEPGLIQKVLGYNSEPLRDVKNFDDVQLYPKAMLSIDQDKLRINLLERAGGTGKISFLINGKEMVEDISSWRKDFNDELITETSNHIEIDLLNYSKFFTPEKKNRIEIVTTNLSRNLSSPVYNIDYIGKVPSGFGGVVERPTLHALIIGTSDYRGEQLDLNFAAKDAEDMASALKTGAHNLFGAEYTNINLLNTDQEDQALQPTKENIATTMKEIAETSGPEDVFVLYFSGHGVTFGEQNVQFHYLTKDVESGDISDPTIRSKYTISTNDMIDWINSIPAQKQVMILDACASGQAVDDLLALGKNVSSSQIKALDKMKDRTGLYIIAGSAANKISYEASQYGQSLLTYSLLSGMNLLSSKDEYDMVDLVEWLNHCKDEVPNLAGTIGGIQEPVVSLPRNLNSFDIAMIPEGSMIPVASVKPVFVRSTLMDMEEMDDYLGLANKLDNYFQNLSSKGRTSKLIFVDVKKFPAAYSIKGFYETSGESIELNATLRKGDEKIGLINVSGSADDVDAIIRQIIDELNGLIGD